MISTRTEAGRRHARDVLRALLKRTCFDMLQDVGSERSILQEEVGANPDKDREQAQKQSSPMTEGRQEQKELRAVLRRLKAVEREKRRHREIARAQRRRVKHRQVSRARENYKYRLHRYEEDIEEIEEDEEYYKWEFESEYRRALWRKLRGTPWQHIDGQGWKVVATYHLEPRSTVYQGDDYWQCGYGCGAYWEGRFLAYNIHRREVLLSNYMSGGGCPICGLGRVKSIDAIDTILKEPSCVPPDAIDTILKEPSCVPTGKAFVAPAEEFLECAQRLVDPAMKLRRAQPEDVGYHSLATLYATYIMFYSRVMPRHTLHSWERMDLAPIAAWSPMEWSLERYNALVRLQALWRGWHFRQRVLYSPHTELGRRFLLRAWHRENSSQM